jgi:hypothetical protein
LIRALCNEIFFGLRKRLPRVRRAYRESLEGPVEQSLIPERIAARLSEKTLRQALFYAEILKDIPWQGFSKSARALDLGSKDFVYLPALASFFSRHYESFELTGLEIDPYQIYYDFFKRGDCAAYYLKLTQSQYQGSAQLFYKQGDWLEWAVPLKASEKFDLITSFFPFLYSDLHLGFGLPRGGFSPIEYYKKCFQWGKSVLFFHQGTREREDSVKLIEKLNRGKIIFQKSIPQSLWMVRKHPVEVILWSAFDDTSTKLQ